MSERTMAKPAGPKAATLLERIAWRVALAAVARIPVGALTIVLPDGERRTFGDPQHALHGTIELHDRAALIRVMLQGETGAGEAYMDGQWSSPDLADLAACRRPQSGGAGVDRGLVPRARPNASDGGPPHPAQHAYRQRRNIAAHYDLGNDFYRLFLDRA